MSETQTLWQRLLEKKMGRRSLIKAGAVAGAATVGGGLLGGDRLAAAAGTRGGGGGATPTLDARAAAVAPFSVFDAIEPSTADRLQVPAGFSWDMLARWGDPINNSGDYFGFNADFTAFFPAPGKVHEGILYVNHEYPSPFFINGYTGSEPKTQLQIDRERYNVGGSFIYIRKTAPGIPWHLVHQSEYNRRVTGATPNIVLTGPNAGLAPQGAIGTVGNCSGGTTPWGTVICEENFQNYFPGPSGENDYGWGPPYDQPHYGYCVEMDPWDPEAPIRKHTGLGMMRHENISIAIADSGRVVVYTGDDKRSEGFYKFVSDGVYTGDKAQDWALLESGTLYVADFENQVWLPISDPALLVNMSVANLRAAGINATPMDRPEDCEVHPYDGSIYLALTNNSAANHTFELLGQADPVLDPAKNEFGHVIRIRETAGQDGLTFDWEVFASGGPTDMGLAGFASPDNLTFDNEANLWVVTDISSSVVSQPTNENYFHRNNAMFMIPTMGADAGVAYRFANGPVEAEMTGPYFTPDFKTMFLAVQHPGEETPNRGGVYGDPETYTGHWPEGFLGTPRPSVVAVRSTEKLFGQS